MNLKNLFSPKRKRDSEKKKIEQKLRSELDLLRTYIDFPKPMVDEYYLDSQKDEYWAVFEKDEPKVSICIATYNRAELLIERSIASALNQSYKNIEVIVVGDHCTDNTQKLVEKISDKRLHFLNLPTRGNYPQRDRLRWMVAGSVPMNKALDLASGDFITHLDDDDEHMSNRVELLVGSAKRGKTEFTWHPFLYEKSIGEWATNTALTFSAGSVTTSSVFYHRWFARIKWDVEAWRLAEPGDWNRFRKFKYLDISSLRIDQPLLKHYKERNQKNG